MEPKFYTKGGYNIALFFEKTDLDNYRDIITKGRNFNDVSSLNSCSVPCFAVETPDNQCVFFMPQKRDIVSIPHIGMITDDVLAHVACLCDMMSSVDVSLRTEELYRFAVPFSEQSFKYFPKDIMTQEMCQEAVESYGNAILSIPRDFVTPELCHVALQRGCHHALMALPRDKITEDLCVQAVKVNGMALYDIPECFITYDLCYQAVQLNGLSLSLVPSHMQDKAMCLEAVKNNGSSLGFVPKELRDKEICLEAFNNTPAAYQYIPARVKEEYFKDYTPEKNVVEPRVFKPKPDFIEKIDKVLQAYCL